MNLYLISQQDVDHDDYDSAVVCAPDEETARNIHPFTSEPIDWESRNSRYGWATKRSEVSVKFIGVASKELKQGSVCASFNAGSRY